VNRVICQSCGQLVQVASYLPTLKIAGLARVAVSLVPICAQHERETQTWENLPAAVRCAGSGCPGVDSEEL
jgi:hypothetical protein